jgi:hypothetical protein
VGWLAGRATPRGTVAGGHAEDKTVTSPSGSCKLTLGDADVAEVSGKWLIKGLGGDRCLHRGGAEADRGDLRVLGCLFYEHMTAAYSPPKMSCMGDDNRLGNDEYSVAKPQYSPIEGRRPSRRRP